MYIDHHRFLHSEHAWRQSRLHNNKRENRAAPKELSGFDILNQLRNVEMVKLGKNPINQDRKCKCTPSKLNWTEKSIFFKLEYW